jgi:membrane protein
MDSRQIKNLNCPFIEIKRIKKMLLKYWDLIQRSAIEWYNNKLSRLAAALAYYTIFSLAPLLIISIAIASIVLEKNSIQETLINNMQEMLGKNAADQIQTMLNVTLDFSSNYLEAIVGVIILLVGASGFFGQLQESLNTVWGVETKSGRGIVGVIRDRFFSFSMVMGLAFLLLVSTLYSIVLNYLYTHFYYFLPASNIIMHVSNSVFTIAIVTFIFAAIFKVLPDVIIKWKDVWAGALITAILFTAGKFALATYFGHMDFSSSFGAASSLIIVIVWVYYSSQILLFGAQFTKVYATANNRHPMKASESAVAIHITKEGSNIV